MRQGDPLYPLLFCIAEEVLGLLITSGIQNHRLIQVKVGHNIFVPHFLFYADDVIIFLKDIRKNIRALTVIFDLYALFSGKHINPIKFKLFFGRNISHSFRFFAENTTGFFEETEPFTYLGAPVFRGSPKSAHFRKIADDMMTKIATWKGSSLCMAGRVCFIKSVIIPSFIHIMKAYLLPKSILVSVDKVVRNFI